MAIKAAGNFLPGTVDTPLDVRSRAATKADILKIENPCLGGIVYCLEDGKHYKITGLKPKLIGSLTVQNAAVDTYEEFASAPVVPPPVPGGGTPLTVWQLTKPADGVHLLVKRAGADGTRASAVTIIDTASNASDRAKVTAYMDAGEDGFWTTCPADGFPCPFDDAPVAVDLSGVEQPAILYFCWLNDSGVAGDWHSQRFPVVGGAGAAGRDGVNGQDGKDGAGQYIACLCQQAPPGVFDGLIWVKGGGTDPQWIAGSSSPAVVVDEIVDPATAADFTIVITNNQQGA